MSDRAQDNGRPPSRKGGPRTREGREVTRLNSLRHGLRSRLLRLGLVPRIRGCVLRVQGGCDCLGRGLSMTDACPALAGLQRDWLATLRRLPHVRPEAWHLAELLVDHLVVLAHARAWLAFAGHVRIEGGTLTAQPLEAALGHRMAEVRRLSQLLCLDPMSARALGVDAIDVGGGPSLEAIRAEYAAADADAPPAPADGDGQEAQP